MKTGIDVLREDDFAALRGQRVALLTNLAARAGDGALTLDVIRGAPGVRLAALFSAEHGLTAALDDAVASGRDARTGLPVHSLYGDTQRPTAAMLAGLDVVVIDLPDVGARFYTYMTTVAYVMEEAAKQDVAVMVLDRPNPINGVDVDGPTLERGLEHFAGYFPMPVRHGLTLGELARLFNGERRIGATLTVVAAKGWRRAQWFDETGLMWTNPSPNIRSLTQATLYPGIGAIEWSNISVGRGTVSPFEQVGAPWIDGEQLARMLNARGIPGVRFHATSFTPASSVYAGERCGGVRMEVTDRAALPAVRLGLEVAAALMRLYPKQYEPRRTHYLLGSTAAFARLRDGESPETIAAGWRRDAAAWRQRRAPYLLY